MTQKLDLTFEDYVTKMARKPKVNKSVVTVGAITTNMYILEADSGMVVYTDQVSGSKTTVEVPWVERKSVSYQGAETSNYIIVMRTNYFLNSSVFGTPLWSLKKSDITGYMTFGSAWEHELPSNMDNKLVLPPMDRKDVPVILLSSDGKLKGSSHDKYMLPLAAHLKSAITLYEEHGKEAYGNLQLSVCNTADSCSQALVDAHEQISVELCPHLECHLETEQILKSPDDKLASVSTLKDSPETADGSLGNKDIAESNTNKMMLWRPQFQNPVPMPYDNTKNFKTLEKSREGLKNGLEVKYDADERTFSIIFSKASFEVIALLLILLASFFTALCYNLSVSSKYDKNMTDLRGQSAAPKKRKARKAGNVKNGVISNNDREASSENDNYETDKFTHVQNNERYSFVNLSRDDDTVNGRWVGRLFVSNSEIGRGSNGTVVFEGVYDGRPVAVKRLLLAHHDVAFKEIQNLIASDRHPNVVRWYGVEQDLDFVYISLERCACSLSDLIQVYSDSSLTLSESLTSKPGSEHKVQLNHWKSSEKDIELWKENGLPSFQLLKLMRLVKSHSFVPASSFTYCSWKIISSSF